MKTKRFFNNINNTPWVAILFAAFTLVILGGILGSGYGLLRIPHAYQDMAEVALPVLAIVGAVALLACLAFLAVAFAALGLTDKSRALGLPEGSIRALIALLLLTFFVVTSVFLYRQIRVPVVKAETATYTGISSEQLAQIPSEQLITIQSRTEEKAGVEETVYDVTRRLPAIPANEASERFAQQILTAISTLVASIAAFYFGIQSVAVARGVTVPLLPVIRSITPDKGKQGEAIENIEILGKDIESPAVVKLVRGSKEMMCADVLASATKIKCKLTIPQDQEAGSYDLVVVNANGSEDRLPDAFEVVGG